MPSIDQISKLARSLPADDRVPYMFEKRVMAHLVGRTVADFTGSIANAMWRAAFSCLLITLVTGAVVTFADESTTELASDLERTVLAPVDVEDSW